MMIGNDYNALTAFNKGAPFQVVYPAPGSNSYSAMGIAAKAAHPNAAKVFIEFVFSKTGQALYPELMSNAPGRDGIKDPRPAAETDWYKPAAEQYQYTVEDMQKSYDEVVAPYPTK